MTPWFRAAGFGPPFGQPRHTTRLLSPDGGRPEPRSIHNTSGAALESRRVDPSGSCPASPSTGVVGGEGSPDTTLGPHCQGYPSNGRRSPGQRPAEATAPMVRKRQPSPLSCAAAEAKS